MTSTGTRFWVAAAGALFFLFIAFSPGRFFASDIGPRLGVARQLWSSGSVFVPGDRSSEGFLFIRERGGSTSLYGIGQSLVLIPFDIVGYCVSHAAAFSDAFRKEIERLPVVFGYAPLVGMLWWLLLALVLRQSGFDNRNALLGAILFGGSTIVWFYASQSVQEEALVSVFLLGSFCTAMGWASSSRPLLAVASGALAVVALTIRLNSVFAILPIAGVVLDAYRGKTQATWWRGIGWAIVGALPIVCLHALFASWRFGSPFSTGYDLGRLSGMGVSWGPLDWNLFVGLVAGFGKGLLVLSPSLLFVLVGYHSWIKRSPFTAAAAVLSIVLSLVLTAKILNNPDGSESWGARYQVHLLSFWIFPFFIGVKRCLEERWRPLAFVVIAISISIQCLSMVAPTSLEYFQATGDSFKREKIISSGSQGQLPLRARNALTWLMGRTVSNPSTDAEANRTFVYMQDRYVPNLWGPVYSRMFGTAWPLVISLALLFCSVGLFAVAFRMK